MTEPKFCGNCGRRNPEGVCRMDQAGFEACAMSMQRPSWKPMNEPEDRQCIDCDNLTPDCTCGMSAAAFETCQGNGLKCFEPRETPEDRVNAWVDEHKARVEAGENAASKWDDDDDRSYSVLSHVLSDAYDQAATGKGKERHATDNKYEDQVICTVGRLLRGHPYGSHAYQIIKKTIEAGRLYKIKGPEAAYTEILGVINYAAAMNILISEDE